MVIDILKALFGAGGNVVRDTAEVFRVNAEASDARAAEMQHAALDQMAAEFGHPRQGLFDRVIDGLNRLPRPAMAFGTLGLLSAAMIDPIWFGERMAGLALVPEPLWWLLGAIVSFYFGARHQAKGQEFQRGLAAALARAPQVVETIKGLRGLRADSPGAADPGADARVTRTAIAPGANPALEAWRKTHGRV